MIRPILLLSAALVFSPLTLLGQQEKEVPQKLSVAAPISDHMVIQQGSKSGVWGEAKPGSEITVSIAGQKHSAQANEAGHWQVQLDPMVASKEGKTLVIADGEGSEIKIQDVLVGEVWMCSGQSNMAWAVRSSANPDAEIAGADFPLIRLFNTASDTAKTPQRNVNGQWEVCSPDTVSGFSAVGYFFGRELVQSLDVPIGLVATAWGGKPSEAFTSRKKLESVSSAKALLEEWDQKQSGYDAESAKTHYETALAKWTEQVAKIRAVAKEKGEKPRFPRRPAQPMEPHLQSNCPAAIYNQKIAPWTQYAIRGAIWYQGESNAARAVQYETLFPALIEDWRDQWKQKDLPFYFVQLANFKTPAEGPGIPDNWAELQNAQTLTLQKLDHTGMAIINDIGEARDIHPRNKQDVGKRLSLWALKNEYGKKIDPISGPIYAKHEAVDGGGVRIHFDHVGSGLKTRDGKELGQFAIAGKDRKYVWADAVIEDGGKTVLVSSAEVAEPASVRYAWAANPEGANLVNSANLPASLFRTDDWELSSAGFDTLSAGSEKRRLESVRKRNASLAENGWNVLFNGENLDGWRNPYKYGEAKVVNSEIHLTADKKFFLVTEKEYGDFTLMAEIHLPEGKANSGIMFRCHVEPGKVYGYQAECDGSDRRWSGGLYDEGRRKWIWPSTKDRSEEKFQAHMEESLAHFAKPEVKGALRRNDWNRYEIRCQGDKIRIKVNGVVTTQIQDDLDAKGYIGIQHHGEKGQTYRFRNIYLKEN